MKTKNRDETTTGQSVKIGHKSVKIGHFRERDQALVRTLKRKFSGTP